MQTRDGCSVELYRQLPYAGEVELIAPSIVGSKILELGCGVGRMTKHLLLAGYDVTAVDNSPEMLEFVPPQAKRVCSNIEELALGAAFDTVVLASNLINVASPSVRARFLAACHRHLRPDGIVIFEHYDSEWLARATTGPAGQLGEVRIHIDRFERHPDHVDISLRFALGPKEWLQHFAAVSLDEPAIGAALVAAGFESPSWINRRWGSAIRPAA